MLTPEDEKQLKEILYLLMEKVRATKASFYLSETAGVFRLAAHFGFGRTDRVADRVHRGDPLVTAVFEYREPRYINDIRQAGRLAETMEAASSTRILTAPLYLDGRIVGILDVRDKAGREPFSGDDISWVTEILRRLANKVRALPRFSAPAVTPEEEFGSDSPLLTSSRTFSIPAVARPPALEGPEIYAAPVPSVPALGDTPAPTYLPSSTARTLRLVEDTLRTSPTPRAAAGPGLSSREVGFHRLAIETCLSMPDVEIVAIGQFDAREMIVALGARRPLAPDLEPLLVESLEKVFGRAGAGFAAPTQRRFRTLLISSPDGAPLPRGEIAAVQSSVLDSTPESVTVLTFVFGVPPGEEGQERLKNIHLLVKNSLVELRAGLKYREAYRILVNKLLEPGLKRYGALKMHSFNVGRMARKFAGFLRLPPVDIEQITVAAILHDDGMRELNYDELYTKRTLTEEEIKLVREHARVGSFLVDEVPWPYAVAPLIRHHHERWDGAGYPDGLRAEQIPFGARLIHLCEAFDAMTSPMSYRSVLSVQQALEILGSKGGTQFDPELAPAFKRMVESSRPER